MFEKVVGKTSNIIKQDGEKFAKSFMQSIKNDLVRSPVVDTLVTSPKMSIVMNSTEKLETGCEKCIKWTTAKQDEVVGSKSLVIVKTHEQLMDELANAVESFWKKDEIINNANKDNIEALIKIAKIRIEDVYVYNVIINRLAPKITSINQDAIPKLAEIKEANGYFIFRHNLENIATAITLKNKEEIVNMALERDSKGRFINGCYDLLNNYKLKEEIKQKIDNVSDPKILNFIKEQKTDKASLRKMDDLLDIYHTFNNDYSHIISCRGGDLNVDVPYNQKYYRYVKKNPDALWDGLKGLLNSNSYLTEAEDFKNESRIDRLRKYCKQNQNDEFANHFYNEYYLKSEMVPPEFAKKCSDINEKFGTKIFLFSHEYQDIEALNYIEAELTEWQRVSGGKAKIPPVLDFSSIKKDYIDNTSVYGESASAGFCEKDTKAISINGCTLSNVKHALRHEMTHANDLLNGFEPSKIYDVIKNCKYKEEFYAAGITPRHTEYAYNDRQEFIAVASEGDMSKYSPEFKELLIDFGMPEWMFDMKNMKSTGSSSIPSISNKSEKTLETIMKTNDGNIQITKKFADGLTNVTKFDDTKLFKKQINEFDKNIKFKNN